MSKEIVEAVKTGSIHKTKQEVDGYISNVVKEHVEKVREDIQNSIMTEGSSEDEDEDEESSKLDEERRWKKYRVKAKKRVKVDGKNLKKGEHLNVSGAFIKARDQLQAFKKLASKHDIEDKVNDRNYEEYFDIKTF